MTEDSALALKKSFENGEEIPFKKAQELLDQSELITKLIGPPKRSPNTFAGLRAYMWRLLELCEIPFTYKLETVRNWIELLVDKSFIGEGFSLEGKRDHLLACHNALIVTILMKIGYEDKKKIDVGINWILKYQSVQRGQECTWTGSDLYTRFGGCMKKVPCFYGVVKSMIALTEYKKRFGSSPELDDKLTHGLYYILKHRVYKRLSSDQPIEDSIILNFYPYTYKSNLIELLTLLKANNLVNDNRCNDALEVLRKKQQSDGFWQADTSYMKSAWIDFDPLKKPGAWISYEISKILSDS
ncbi:MAG: hypothetical protein ACW986_07520 [Promethearchaeota archaeon]|jgi:hypothetical protein